jgi:hypothetical protein
MKRAREGKEEREKREKREGDDREIKQTVNLLKGGRRMCMILRMKSERSTLNDCHVCVVECTVSCISCGGLPQTKNDPVATFVAIFWSQRSDRVPIILSKDNVRL